ncbi:MAG: glycosyltransferase family 4 protein [Candidatus Marinimicrobia bacterium]|nr:glycosyltransferase family 4 protein [Candidatus Neomarinimicrobiota bacterium]
MNILHTETLKGWGGQQNKVLKECIALRELNHQIILICNPNSKIGEQFRLEKFDVIEKEMNKGNILKNVFFFLKIFKKFNISMIITHGSTDSWVGGISARLSSIKLISLRERHNLFPIRSSLSKWLHNSLFNGILSISDVVSEYLTSIGVKKNRIHHLPDSVNIKNFTHKNRSLRLEYNIPDNAIVIGSFTSLRPEKGVWDLFKLCKSVLHHPNVWFIFGGTKYTEIEQKINHELNTEGHDTTRVIWTGFRKDVGEVYASFDIFVHLTHSEGMGTVLLEAMASHLPVIVWDRRPMSDIIVNNSNGICVPFGNHNKVVSTIDTLVHDKQLRDKMGDIGRSTVVKKYGDDSLKKRLKEIIDTQQLKQK